MKTQKIMLLTLVLFMCQTLLVADDLKVAMIDMQKAYKEYYKTKITLANLNRQSEIFKSYAEKLNDSRLKLQEEFKSLRDASLNIGLTETERESKKAESQKKQRQFQEKDVEMVQYYKEKKAQLMDDYEKNRVQLLSDIKKEVEKKRALEGYTIVLNISNNSPSDMPSVVSYNQKYDITDIIIEELNKGHKPQNSDKGSVKK